MKEEITISREKVAEVYQNASAETKEALKAIFGQECFKSKPTLDDYTTIRSYEDACEALGENPILNGNLDIFKNGWKCMNFPTHIKALMKLETISRALWGRTWRPEPDTDCSKSFFIPFFVLYTKSEIEHMDEEKRSCLLSACVNDDADAGFGGHCTSYRSSIAPVSYGFRLCQETEEKARHFGQQFIELWAEYLKFGFEVGGRLK